MLNYNFDKGINKIKLMIPNVKAMVTIIIVLCV